MKKLNTNRYVFLLLCFVCVWVSACQNQESNKGGDESEKREYVYEPQKGRLVIASETANPEISRVTLFRDNEIDSVTSITPQAGKFKLEVDDIITNEIYFLKITGTSTKRGTSGLAWTEQVPVLALPSGELELVQQAFNNAGSISKVKFSIKGGGEDQQFLNDWQAALAELQADEAGKTEHYTIGARGATRIAGKKESSKNPASITSEFVGQQKPLISSFYLISRLGKHRQQAEEYQNLLQQASESAKNSKYGIELASRLDRIQTKIKQLDLENKVVATDARLAEIPWDTFKDRKYLLLSFWNSSDQAAVKAVKELKNSVPELESNGIDVLLISVESVFSQWRDAAKGLDFKYSYKVRNEAQQALVDELYLSDLPRLVLVKPNGEVVEDNLDIDQVKELE